MKLLLLTPLFLIGLIPSTTTYHRPPTERDYCLAFEAGEEVVGGTREEVTKFCNKILM